MLGPHPDHVSRADGRPPQHGVLTARLLLCAGLSKSWLGAGIYPREGHTMSDQDHRTLVVDKTATLAAMHALSGVYHGVPLGRCGGVLAVRGWCASQRGNPVGRAAIIVRGLIDG